MAALLLFGGTVGKSAQFPLHVWLPDAMAGPTPVSALIHAATMVAAGVYLVGRMFEIFLLADHVGADDREHRRSDHRCSAPPCWRSCRTTSSACSRTRRSRSSPTWSPGSRSASRGCTAGFFHLFTHAFFKALLFLCAGSVIHAVHSNNMSDMGGLRKSMPVTFWTMLIGSLALAGIFPLAGFWSKDELLVVAEEEHVTWLFVVFLVTAVITAFYTMRMLMLTFFGQYKGHAHPHESPRTMTGPLVALAAATIGVGLLGSPQLGAVFGQWVFFEEIHEAVFLPWIALLSTAGALLGLAGGFLLYRDRKEQDPLQAPMGPIWNVLQQRYYVDDFYMRAIVYPVRDGLSAAVNWFNQTVIDGVVNGVAVAARGFGQIVAWFDRTVIDGVVNGVGEGAGRSGNVLKQLQSGNVQWYAVGLFVGVIALAVVFIRVV